MAPQSNMHDPVIHSESATSGLNHNIHDPPQPTLVSSAPSPRAMNVWVLADHCMNEIDNYRRGQSSNDQYGVELFRRALIERDALAWEVVQQCLNDTLLRWMRGHPLRDTVCRFDSEEKYVALAFARFWLATVSNQEIEFRTLAAALRYLRASLHGAILDTLRTYSRPHKVPLPEQDDPGEPLAEEQDDGRDLWEVIQNLIPDEREQRLTYLIFHCGLKPREIVRFCPKEFSEVQEIYRLRRNIVERLLRNADYIRWRLNTGVCQNDR
jgi:hypothetical protein